MAYSTLKEKSQKKEINVPDKNKVEPSSYVRKLHVKDKQGQTWTVDRKDGDQFVLIGYSVPKHEDSHPVKIEKKINREEFKQYELA